MSNDIKISIEEVLELVNFTRDSEGRLYSDVYGDVGNVFGSVEGVMLVMLAVMSVMLAVMSVMFTVMLVMFAEMFTVVFTVVLRGKANE